MAAALVLAGLEALALAPGVAAVETASKAYQSAADFAPGEMDHVSVSAEGRIVLSPGYRRLANFDEAAAWSVAETRAGLFVATGHEGRLLKVAPAGGDPATALDAPELEVQAVAAGADGTVWAATSPDGKVYRIAPDGVTSVVFDPEERYVWALLAAPDGSLYVGTGDPGRVYRIGADGRATNLMSIDDTHVLALALAGDGTLFAGSGGAGYVYRRDTGGEVRVLLDADGSEVKALALDGEGRLFAASTGVPRAGAVLGPSPAAGTAAAGSEPPDDAPIGEGEGIAAESPQAQPSPIPGAPAVLAVPPAAVPVGRPSWLYRIRPDGLPEEIWRSAAETVHAMALFDGRVVLGTGNEGKVLAVDSESGRSSILLDFPGAQVTGLAAGERGLAVTTSNLAALWRVEAAPAERGSYLSPVIDAGAFAVWGRVKLLAQGPVHIATRSGNTAKPGPHWSGWAETSGEVKSPRARYLQYRLELGAERGARRPEVREVEVSYLPYNLAPEVRSVTLLAPGVALLAGEPAAGSEGAGRRSRPRVPAKERPSPREQEAAGVQSARWEAVDPNADPLVYAISYRGDGETAWKLLAEDVSDPFLSFDSTALPDGIYELLIEASDSPANPDAVALKGERMSDPFVIDNTPPSVEVTSSTVGGEVRVRAHLQDRTSAVAWAEYAVDAEAPRPLLPEDQVFDEGDEVLVFAIPTRELETGEHTLIVRTEDAAGNAASGKAIFRLP